jgi:hypothetical protein
VSIINDDGFGIDDFAASLFAGEIIAEHERPYQMPEKEAPLIPDDDKEQWEKE